MKKKQIETLLYSVAGVGAMFLIVVALNFILGTVKLRGDFTQEKAYTLSAGTKAILKKLDGPVEIRFYCTQGEKEMPPQFKTYAQHVEDLLSEYQVQGRANIEIKKLNPTPDSDAEEEKEKLLEYDITRAISRVANPQKPVIGVMTPLPMFGQPMNPMMMRMGQQPQEAWVIISELQKDFTVKPVPLETDKIDDDIKVLMVAHPKEIKDSAQYAIDQFIMRGGKLIAFLDGMSMVDSRNQQNPMMPNMGGGGSTLDKLVKAWGIQFDTTKVVADLNFQSRFVQNNRQQVAPAVLSLNPQGINKEDVVTSQLDSLLIPFAGVFTGTPATGLKETVLLHTTPDSQLVEGFAAQFSGEQITKDFKPSGTPQKLAIRLSGKFKTAFPDGKPVEKEADKKDEKKDEKKTEDSLKETKGDNAVILVGDSDILYDQFCVQVQNFFGQKVVIPRNGNLNLVQNMVEQMAGDSNLIEVRSRAPGDAEALE